VAKEALLEWYHAWVLAAGRFLALGAAAYACTATGPRSDPRQRRSDHSFQPVQSPKPRRPSVKPSKAIWKRFAESKSWPTLSRAPFVSQGHGFGNYRAVVRANSVARPGYEALQPGCSLPPGSILFETVTDLEGSGQEEHYVMEKAPDGGWRFLVLSREGVIESQANVTLCQRCHAEAPSDHVFGLPRSAADPDPNFQDSSKQGQLSVEKTTRPGR
jgi:hypothetical protein